MRFAYASQRKHRADHRLDQAAFDQVGQRIELASVLTGEHEMVGGVLPIHPSCSRFHGALRSRRDIGDGDIFWSPEPSSLVPGAVQLCCRGLNTDRYMLATHR